MTVGFGIAPNLLTLMVEHEALAGFRPLPVTAGGDFHPALRTFPPLHREEAMDNLGPRVRPIKRPKEKGLPDLSNSPSMKSPHEVTEPPVFFQACPLSRTAMNQAVRREGYFAEGCLVKTTSYPKSLPPARISLDIGSPPFAWLKPEPSWPESITLATRFGSISPAR